MVLLSFLSDLYFRGLCLGLWSRETEVSGPSKPLQQLVLSRVTLNVIVEEEGAAAFLMHGERMNPLDFWVLGHRRPPEGSGDAISLCA